jgi:hypothetical protein
MSSTLSFSTDTPFRSQWVLLKQRGKHARLLQFHRLNEPFVEVCKDEQKAITTDSSLQRTAVLKLGKRSDSQRIPMVLSVLRCEFLAHGGYPGSWWRY